MNKLNYFIALVYSAFLVQAATVLLVLSASAEMAFSKWVAMHFLGNCVLALFVLVTVHGISLVSLLFVLLNCANHHLRKTPAGELLEQLMDIPTHLFSAIIRRIDRL